MLPYKKSSAFFFSFKTRSKWVRSSKFCCWRWKTVLLKLAWLSPRPKKSSFTDWISPPSETTRNCIHLQRGQSCVRLDMQTLVIHIGSNHFLYVFMGHVHTIAYVSTSFLLYRALESSRVLTSGLGNAALEGRDLSLAGRDEWADRLDRRREQEPLLLLGIKRACVATHSAHIHQNCLKRLRLRASCPLFFPFLLFLLITSYCAALLICFLLFFFPFTPFPCPKLCLCPSIASSSSSTNPCCISAPLSCIASVCGFPPGTLFVR